MTLIPNTRPNGQQIILARDFPAGGRTYRKGTPGAIAGHSINPADAKVSYKIEVNGKYFWVKPDDIKKR